MKLNLNGTSGEVLTRQLMDVAQKAEALLESLNAAFPHGRDFQTYPDPAEAYRVARSEAIDRSKQVNGVLAWAIASIDDIQNQGERS